MSRGRLIRKDYFSYVRYASEYCAPYRRAATLYQRRFYHEDGRVVYDMLIEDGQEKIYRFPDRIFYSRLSWFVIFSSVCSCRQMTWLSWIGRQGLVGLSLRRVRRLSWSSGPCGAF